jgi:prolyl-tRNA synthetase
MRGREFLMKDLYSFHTDPADLQRYYEIVAESYDRVFRRLGLDALKVEASGGTFSKFSHEYQVLTPNGEDEIYRCEACGLAYNKEIVEDPSKDPQGHPWTVVRGSEVGNIFQLNTKFTEPFKGMFADESGQEKMIYMGCYGIGVSRLMGVIAEVYNDDAGLKWPRQVAPYDVHLVSLGDNAEVRRKSEELYELLKGSGFDVLWDDRDLSPGAKFADADLIGLPVRVVISERSLAAGGAEMKRRDEEGKGSVIPLEGLLPALRTEA